MYSVLELVDHPSRSHLPPIRGPSFSTFAPRGRCWGGGGEGSSLLYFYIAYYMQKGGRGGGVQKACSIA